MLGIKENGMFSRTSNVLRQVFSLRMFLFGWSYFWRAFLLMQIPWFIASGVHKIFAEGFRHGKADTALLIIIPMWLAYVIWACFANGIILNQLQHSYELPNKYIASRFLVGAKMVGALLLFAVIFILPANAIGFVVGLGVGLGFGFHGLPESEVAGASKVAAYFVNSFVSVFVLGYLAQRVIAHQLRKENKDFVPPMPAI
ncbi:MAG: hypothetical protein L6277_16240 [Desulfobacterales bacterium]|nr:hypothetical protein [Pseudomonadota bacterium]MCG2773621.1 hypothetical protein [Desulfobacterales bacterium]